MAMAKKAPSKKVETKATTKATPKAAPKVAPKPAPKAAPQVAHKSTLQRVTDKVEEVAEKMFHGHNAQPPAVAAAAPIPVREPLDFTVNPDSLDDLRPIAKVAWDAVRGADDATFDACLPQFQRKLLEHASSALRTGPQSGDTNLALFEQKVISLRDEGA